MGLPADLSLFRSHIHKNELCFIAKWEKCGVYNPVMHSVKVMVHKLQSYSQSICSS